ncbi:hypothetical protein [Vibrio sp. SCSIO 43136]|uniref:hypothetical protein n=1 Tax=Vibrio sp. SCSIO 43136 TaxID=2819101 RepID=UPI0020755815|nr:hypothetical protein [Vibrio sp. SCSIO 43136]USD64257.1 hypothetical protein J4N39_09055 [Vibrio sp. SCSIO 43136]
MLLIRALFSAALISLCVLFATQNSLLTMVIFLLSSVLNVAVFDFALKKQQAQMERELVDKQILCQQLTDSINPLVITNLESALSQGEHSIQQLTQHFIDLKQSQNSDEIDAIRNQILMELQFFDRVNQNLTSTLNGIKTLDEQLHNYQSGHAFTINKVIEHLEQPEETGSKQMAKSDKDMTFF